MKKLIIPLLLLTACSKNNPTPTPSPTPTPTNPNYAKGRKPLPKWGVDTFICIDQPQHRIDSFYSSIGANGESIITHNGKQYAFWIDSIFLPPNATNELVYVNISFGNTINDSTDLNNYQITYQPPFYINNSGDTMKGARAITFGEGFLNPNAMNYYWQGRYF